MNANENARELRRLQALEAYAILDTPPEEDFDDVAKLASDICATPIAVVNLIGDRRQFFKAEVGLGVRETPFGSSFCAKAILENDFLMVPNATEDARFDCNPLVTGEPHLRFYAGAILKTPEGLPVGTVCVLDYEPRELDEVQQRTLRVLASQVMARLELRRVAALEASARRAEREEKARYKAVFDSATDYAIIVMDRAGLVTDWNEGAIRILGWERSEAVGRDGSFFFTPEDREAGIPDQEMQSALESGHGMDERWHLRKGGERFWANGELMPLTAEDGSLQGYLKILRVQTSERLQEDQKQLLLEEMAHRVKNSFAVNGGVKTGHGAEQKSATVAPA
ncbi:PAS domain S-box protein [Rhizobium sp. Rhizsp82]|uniref:PAS domain S-box protein n=1 Tax=Rhizobium sp. Rhizsp82 TaxID=3243057 RepID=UPI0039B5765B